MKEFKDGKEQITKGNITLRRRTTWKNSARLASVIWQVETFFLLRALYLEKDC